MEKRSQSQVVPFLKWAGGKRWLLQTNGKLVPDEFNTYLEPFLGSGAVFFALRPTKSILSDLNEELVNTYSCIKSNPKLIQRYLNEHQRRHSKEYYYQLRGKSLSSPYTRAAKFLYLNRTCWNGLYRVNLKGEFNVPIGTKSSVSMDTDNFGLTSKVLEKAEIKCADFESTINCAKKGDFVFVDPPYTVKHNLNGFLKYNEKIFSWEDQLRLKSSIEKALDRGVKVTMSNANHSSIVDLYEDLCEIETISRASVLSGKREFRGKTTELLMRIGW